MMDVPRTPASTLTRARNIALQNGIHYAYTGNVHDRDGDTTFCTQCGERIIERDWYEINRYHLTDDGRCQSCGSPCAGVFAGQAGHWGRRRLPIRLAAK